VTSDLRALAIHRQPAGMTALGRHAARVDELPGDAATLAGIIQGLFVHEYMADAYGFDVPELRRQESHIRPLIALIDRVLALDGRPLSVARPVEKRVIGVCHHPMLLLVGFLRAKGIAARGRCGQGAYFNPGWYEDHWLCEYWRQDEQRWVLADPQFDEVWRRQLKISHDVLDVPRDQFLVAADAWKTCRAGDADPAKFGIFQGNLRGLWFLAGSLVRDLAALNNVEVLPWDVWGAIPQPNQPLHDDELAFFDRVAAITSDPGASFGDVRSLYADERVRVPAKVFNALRQRQEPIDLGE
jgi:hypothetical protein